MSYRFVVNLCCPKLQEKMENYGHLLLCPVCKELITHPVLLPCQHSVCYGCARSQILAADSPGCVSVLTEVTPTLSRNRNLKRPEDSITRNRSLRSSPSESSLLSCSSSKRDSGIETSPSLTSPLTKGFSFVSTASSASSSGSNELKDSEEREKQFKSNQRINNSCRILPQLSSSPRSTRVPRQTSFTESRLTKSVTSLTQDPVNRFERDDTSLETNGKHNEDSTSSVVYITDDMVHFEASIVNGNKLSQPLVSEDKSSPPSAQKQRKIIVKKEETETPKSTGTKQRKISSSKLPRRNSNINGLFSPTGGGNINSTSYSTPPPSYATTSFRRSSQKSSGGLRRSNSTSTIIRSSAIRSCQQRVTDVIKRSKVKSLFCPTCELDVELGRYGIKGLFRNFALESIVERFRTAAKAAVAIRCGYCKPPASDATKSCLDCKLSYCNRCYKTVHVWGTKKAQHEFVGPTNNFSRPKVMLCPEHDTEAVNMYCNRCKHSVCSSCKSRGSAHANHPVISVKNAYKENKDNLFALLNVLRNKKEAMDEEIGNLENDLKRFEEEEAAVRDEIHTAIDEMHKLLELKRTQLLDKADYFCRNNENEMRRSLQNLRNNVMFSSVMAFAEEVLLETNPAYFLQTVKMVETRIHEAIDHMSETTRSENKNDQEIDSMSIIDGDYVSKKSMLHLHLNTNPVKNAIGTFDFLSVPGKPILNSEFKNRVAMRPLEGMENEPNSSQWILKKGTDEADIFELKYWRNLALSDEENVSEYHHVANGLNFFIPSESGIYQKEGIFFVKVRGINKAGTGNWSDVTTLSPEFLRREDFKFISDDHFFTISNCGRIARSLISEDFQNTMEFHFLTGDVTLSRQMHYWEVEARGDSQGHFLLGLANFEQYQWHPQDFCHLLDPKSSALLYCGPKECYVVESKGRELRNIPQSKGRLPRTAIVETISKRRGSLSSSPFFPLKPLKQLKNSILRRSSFTGSIGSINMKTLNSRINESNDTLANGSEHRLCGGLFRSSSATSLPSIIHPPSSTSESSSSTHQWNVQKHVGHRIYRIGVKMNVIHEHKVKVQFSELDTSGYSSKTLFSKTLEFTSHLTPVLAMAGNGRISLL